MNFALLIDTFTIINTDQIPEEHFTYSHRLPDGSITRSRIDAIWIDPELAAHYIDFNTYDNTNLLSNNHNKIVLSLDLTYILDHTYISWKPNDLQIYGM